MSTVLVILVSALVSCQATITNSQLTDGSNALGYDLSNELYVDSITNLWISPFCITSCFGLIYPGTGGDTQTQIANVMNFPLTASDPSDITQQYFSLQSSIESTYDGQSGQSVIGIANKIYISNLITPKQAYIDALYDPANQQSFIEQNFDFSAPDAAKIINQWVDDNTNGLIDGIIPDDADVSLWRLVALNAIYLNGSFASPFKTYMTSSQKFYTNGLRTEELSDIYLMHQQDYFGYYSDGNYQFLKFSFSDSTDLFVLFALPINSQLYPQRNGLITDENLIKTAISNLERTYISLALPQISVSKGYELKVPLQTMGMTNAFIPGLADFSNVADGVDLSIDIVIHKTMIEMDEDGLVAAAVTAIAIGITSVQPPPPKSLLFKADHPFQMFIIDGNHENTILFMGQINEPGIPEGSETPNYVEPIESIWNDFSLYTDNSDPPTTTLPLSPCASTICEIGTKCYETSKGARCFDPSICESGICGGFASSKCAEGYECDMSRCEFTVTCPTPKGGGICIQGCNSDDECANNQLCCSNGCGQVCTDSVIEKPNLFDCAGVCVNPDATRDSKVPCTVSSNCDRYKGYKCKTDPICRGQRRFNKKCANNKVCLKIQKPNGMCSAKSDCVSGYKCVGIRNGNGYCVDYQCSP